MVLFCFNRFIYYFYLFSSFDVSYVLSISSSSSFDRQCKLEGGKRFLSMSTCRTLTLRCCSPIVNWPPKKFTVSAPYKRVSMRTCCRSTDETHYRIPQQVSWQRLPLKLAGKVIPNLQWNRRNPKIHRKKERKLGKRFCFWAFIFWATEVIFLIQLLVRVGRVFFLFFLLLFLLCSFFLGIKWSAKKSPGERA